MEMKHMILECYCNCEEKTKDLPCEKFAGKMGIHCLQNSCKYFSYTGAPNEIAYSSERKQLKSCVL